MIGAFARERFANAICDLADVGKVDPLAVEWRRRGDQREVCLVYCSSKVSCRRKRRARVPGDDSRQTFLVNRAFTGIDCIDLRAIHVHTHYTVVFGGQTRT